MPEYATIHAGFQNCSSLPLRHILAYQRIAYHPKVVKIVVKYPFKSGFTTQRKLASFPSFIKRSPS